LLGEAFGKTNQVDAGLRILEEALGVVQRNEEACYQAELERLKGELLLAQTTGPPAAVQAEACFQRSLQIARKQKAKSWELRSALSLARLHKNQNKQAMAHKLLAEIYNKFTEGFETMDLREAKTLLNELSDNS
jgi:predicted ATPase